jgi:transposase
VAEDGVVSQDMVYERRPLEKLGVDQAATAGSLWLGVSVTRVRDSSPVAFRLTGGQVADCVEADALIETLGEGGILLADKGYDTDAIRAKAAARKAWANIPPKANRKGTFVFSGWVYRQRNLVERFFNRIKQFRGIATRYDKDPEKLPRSRQADRSEDLVPELMSRHPRRNQLLQRLVGHVYSVCDIIGVIFYNFW